MAGMPLPQRQPQQWWATLRREQAAIVCYVAKLQVDTTWWTQGQQLVQWLAEIEPL